MTTANNILLLYASRFIIVDDDLRLTWKYCFNVQFFHFFSPTFE